MRRVPSKVAGKILVELYDIKKHYCARCDLYIDNKCIENRNMVKCHKYNKRIGGNQNESKSNN